MLANELIHHADQIVERWHTMWRRTRRAHPELSESALKDRLPLQLRVIGHQLSKYGHPEDPNEMWNVTERLDPETRMEQDFPIEDVVQEYRVLVETVHNWIKERTLEISYEEYAYFSAAIFELTAESVRRCVTYKDEEVRKDRAEYLAGVMHQLRTPLSAVLMQVELLDRRAGPPDAAAISRLRRNVRRIRVLVEGVLRLERFDPSEMRVRPQELYPARLIDDIMRDYENEAAQKPLRFEARVNRSLRMTLDADLFVDALGNLVQNAVKYTTAGSVIVDAEEHHEMVDFCVQDSGPGIPEDRRQTLFRQAQPGSGGGVGIGLRIAQHAAEALGGQIDVDSSPGKGSTFTLRLPYVVAAREGDAG